MFITTLKIYVAFSTCVNIYFGTKKKLAVMFQKNFKLNFKNAACRLLTIDRTAKGNCNEI